MILKKMMKLLTMKLLVIQKFKKVKENLASHCSELYGCQSVDAQEQIINENYNQEQANLKQIASSACYDQYKQNSLTYNSNSGLDRLKLSWKNQLPGGYGIYEVTDGLCTCPREFSEQIKSGTANQFYARQVQLIKIPDNNQ